MTLRAWLELARLSNAPTVISNVLVGSAIGAASSGLADLAPLQILTLSAAMLLVYVGGMALNDVVDADVDRQQRPDRPIPSGRISRPAALAFAIACLAAGAALIAPFGWPALSFGAALVGGILLYDLLHRKHPVTAIIMGVCRALVYLTCAAAMAWPLEWRLAGPLGAVLWGYITLVTLIAQVEAEPEGHRRRWLAILLPLVALCALMVVAPDESRWWALLTGLIAVGWMLLMHRHLRREPPDVRRAVMGFLAGICLLDLFLLTLLDRPALALIALACFAVTVIGHRFILGT